MLKWLRMVLHFFVGMNAATSSRSSNRREVKSRPTAFVTSRRSYPLVVFKRHEGEGRPSELHWKASHPKTIKRFKAEVTCSRGHAIALRDHTVEADGRVIPSIVCKEAGCDFHEVVRLEGWSSGRIPAKPLEQRVEAA